MIWLKYWCLLMIFVCFDVCRSRQIFGRTKDFGPKSPKLARKVLCDFCSEIFYHKESFLVWPPKKDSCVFLQTLGTIFWIQTTLGTIFSIQTTLGAIFARIFRDFSRISTNQNYWGTLSTPAPSPPTPLPLENPVLALAWKKSFQRPSLGVHAHLPKCWRGTWPEKVWEPLL